MLLLCTCETLLLVDMAFESDDVSSFFVELPSDVLECIKGSDSL